MTDISHAFIPTENNNHLPYLLTFPVGLELFREGIIISYGEGDERSKLIHFSDIEV